MNNPFRLFFLFAALALNLVFSPPVRGDISFSGLALSGDNRLLFRAVSEGGGVPSGDALFITPLDGALPLDASAEKRVRQLSVFPEKMDLLENGRVLQIQNAFGVFRLPVSGGLPAPVPGLPSFTAGNLPPGGRAEKMIPSGDGRWLLYLEPESPGFGNLVMLDAHSGAKIQVASRLDRPEKRFPAAWSPDSRFFVYERGGKLYYYMAGSSPMPADERVRFIGDGAINSISWGGGGDFFYLRGSTLFRIRGAELFARAVYAGFLEPGAAAGHLPFEFDPRFDDFWVAPDAASLLVSKGRRSLFYYPLPADDGASSRETLLPWLLLPRSCSGISVLWPEAGTVTVLAAVPDNGGTEERVYRLNIGTGKEASALLPLPSPPAGAFLSGSLSPDGKLALFWGEGGITLYDYANWKALELVSGRPGKACLWLGNGEFIAGDDQKIERFTLVRGPSLSGGEAASRTPPAFISGRALVCLSRVSEAGFEESGSRVLAKSGDAWFVTDGKNPWAAINNPRPGNPSQVSARYRVYLEKQETGFFLNLPMVRNTASVGTFPLFAPATASARPAAGAGRAALCFDLYDDDRGLPETLEALGRFGVKATFFLNGEFLRRHPGAARRIAEAGHEAASMFFAPVDFTDTRYRYGSDFIPRGLARNEDEYYRAAGKELALLWHAPWYAASPDLNAAAAKAGYVTVNRDIDPLDWVSRDDEKTLGLSRRSPSETIDFIAAEVKPGSVIPVRLGLLPGGRDDYLFNRINVLIEALLRKGYTLTTVSGILAAR